MRIYKDSDRPLNHDPYDYHVQNGIEHRVIENGYTWFNCVYIEPSQVHYHKMLSAENRTKALQWWNDLTNEEKQKFFDGYNLYTPAKDHTQITGSQIQNIWAVQTNK